MPSLTVRDLIERLSKARNPDMVVVVCDRGVPYRELYETEDGTGTLEDSEKGEIDGLFLLFAEGADIPGDEDK
jgi:hypothetical protein